jgi:hypothetical protein
MERQIRLDWVEGTSIVVQFANKIKYPRSLATGRDNNFFPIRKKGAAQQTLF